MKRRHGDDGMPIEHAVLKARGEAVPLHGERFADAAAEALFNALADVTERTGIPAHGEEGESARRAFLFFCRRVAEFAGGEEPGA